MSAPGAPGPGEDPINRAYENMIQIDANAPPAPPYVDPEEQTPAARGAALDLNDHGNGKRLALYFGEGSLFIPRLGWHRWDGTRWLADEDEIEVRRDAQAISGLIAAEADFISLQPWEVLELEGWHAVKDEFLRLNLKLPSQRSEQDIARLAALTPVSERGKKLENKRGRSQKGHRDFGIKSGDTGRISAMIKEAQTSLAISLDQINRDLWAVNCENGTLKFSMQADDHAAAWGEPARTPSVTLYDHDRDDRITKKIAARYVPEAPRPAFEAFLERIMPDPENRAFLKRWFGYSLTGDTSEQCLAFFFGGGRNGKSTLIDIVSRIMGDYSTSIPIETLTGAEQRKGSDATPDLVRLPGARFVRASEPEQGQKMKEALIKQLTGGEPIMVRRMHKEFIEIWPTFKLTISGNHKPEVRGADDGIWRRILLVLFGQQIPIDEVDRDLPARLMAEADGIFAWMVEGLLDYMAGGLAAPASILAETAKYREESDPMRTWLLQACEITGDPSHWERAADLVDAFQADQIDSGIDPWGKRAVSNNLKARANNVKGPTGAVYIAVKRSSMGYRGIRLTAAARDLVVAHRQSGRP